MNIVSAKVLENVNLNSYAKHTSTVTVFIHMTGWYLHKNPL